MLWDPGKRTPEEGEGTMSTQQAERDVIDRPHVNSWRVVPTDRQLRYAESLCRTELPYAERVVTVRSLETLDCSAVSALISRLELVHKQRMARLRRTVHGRRR